MRLVFAAAILVVAALTLAAENPTGIAWQDYTQAMAAAKKANKPVLIDFWRPG
jgi:hypothetical protein